MSSLLLLLAAIQLPEHVPSPGDKHLALALGVERGAPAAEVRLGVMPWVALEVEGVFWREAPIFGAKLRLAAGARDNLFVHAFALGHLRPLLNLDVISGGDGGGGVGITSRLGDFTSQLDAGLIYGLNVEEAAVDVSAPDQRGGFWIQQRLSLSYDLWARFALGTHLDVQIPFERGQLASSPEGVGRWRLTTGVRAFLRL